MEALRIKRGNPFQALITLTGLDDQPMNLTEVTVIFTVRSLTDKALTDAAALIRKVITIHSSPGTGQTYLDLSSEQTTLPPGTYIGDVRVVGSELKANTDPFLVEIEPIVTTRIIEESVLWGLYWDTLISATVEDAAPTDVILTFPEGKPELIDTDITATVNGIARAVSSASWTGAAWTVVLASAVEYGDVVVMTFVKTGGTTAVTNNVAEQWSSYWKTQWYGIEINEANTSPDVTRIASTMDEVNGKRIHAELPVHSQIKGCLLLDNGTVNYYLDPTDWSKKADGTASDLTGADGQVMIEWPDFYYKVDMNGGGAGKHQIKISMGALTGFTKVPKHYVSAYEAAMDRVNSKLSSVKSTDAQYRGGNNNDAWDEAVNSLLGKPATSINRTNFRTYAQNRGSGWNQYGYNDHKWLFWLFAIQYATLNSQKAVNTTKTAQGYFQGGLGDGVSTASGTEWKNFCGYNPFIPCGASDSLGNGSGEVNYEVTDFGGTGVNRTFSVARFLGHENPFGHIWMILDGININIQAADSGGESQVFVADSPAAWNDSNFTGYTNRGLMHRANGYMNKALLGAGAEFVPSEAGSSGSGTGTYYCDYFYTSIPASGSNLRMLIVGGSAADGARGGFAYSASDNAPSDAIVYFGSRLRFEGA